MGQISRLTTTNLNYRRRKRKKSKKERGDSRKESSFQERRESETSRYQSQIVVTGVRTASDGTIVSYDINADGCVTTHHGRYMSKLKNADEERESSEET